MRDRDMVVIRYLDNEGSYMCGCHTTMSPKDIIEYFTYLASNEISCTITEEDYPGHSDYIDSIFIEEITTQLPTDNGLFSIDVYTSVGKTEVSQEVSLACPQKCMDWSDPK